MTTPDIKKSLAAKQKTSHDLAFILHHIRQLLTVAIDTCLYCEPTNPRAVKQLETLKIDAEKSISSASPTTIHQRFSKMNKQLADICNNTNYARVSQDLLQTVFDDMQQVDVMLDRISTSSVFTNAVAAHNTHAQNLQQRKDAAPSLILLSDGCDDKKFEEIKNHDTIYFTVKNHMQNPALFPYGKFAGTVKEVVWPSTVTKRMYEHIRDMAIAQGLSEPHYVLMGRPSPNIAVNFVIIPKGGEYIWRKYDVGSGSGQNYIYTPSGKFQTSLIIKVGKI